MRKTFLVTYDIRDDKRLRKIFRTLRDWGTICSTRSLNAN